MIRRHRNDIPLRRDGTARLLPWLVAPMIYLAALALAGMLGLHGVLQTWDRGLAGTMTVELPPAQGPQGDKSLAAALALLRATPGVTRADTLSAAAEGKLLKPWLGTSIETSELQLPRLIDLRIASGAAINVARLQSQLTTAVPGAVLDDHRVWLDRLYDLTLSVETAGLAILAMVSAACVLTVIFTTRASLAVHHDVIELLHLTGARDSYIARQFEHEAMRLGFGGGVTGIVLAALTLWGLQHVAATTAIFGEEARLLPDLSLVLWQWLSLALLPVAAGFAAMMTARLTVLGALARMP